MVDATDEADATGANDALFGRSSPYCGAPMRHRHSEYVRLPHGS